MKNILYTYILVLFKILTKNMTFEKKFYFKLIIIHFENQDLYIIRKILSIYNFIFIILDFL